MNINSNWKIDHKVVCICEHLLAEAVVLLGDIPDLLPLHGQDPVLNVLPAAALAEVADNGEHLVSSSIHDLDGWHKECPLQAEDAQLCPEAVDSHGLLSAVKTTQTAEDVRPATW